MGGWAIAHLKHGLQDSIGERAADTLQVCLSTISTSLDRPHAQRRGVTVDVMCLAERTLGEDGYDVRQKL